MNKHSKQVKITKEGTAQIFGHSPQHLPWGKKEYLQSCFDFKSMLKIKLKSAIKYGIHTFLISLSEGFDMIAAEILLELKNKYQFKIIAVVEYLGKEEKWHPGQQARYNNILLQCDDVIVLSDYYYPNCMQDATKFMVEHSNYCIACCHLKNSNTYTKIKYAKEMGNKIKIIKPNVI